MKYFKILLWLLLPMSAHAQFIGFQSFSSIHQTHLTTLPTLGYNQITNTLQQTTYMKEGSMITIERNRCPVLYYLTFDSFDYLEIIKEATKEAVFVDRYKQDGNYVALFALDGNRLEVCKGEEQGQVMYWVQLTMCK